MYINTTRERGFKQSSFFINNYIVQIKIIMAKESISYINLGDGENHPIDAVTVGGKSAIDFQENRIVTRIDSSSDDEHYPSAKCMYDIIGELERRLSNI